MEEKIMESVLFKEGIVKAISPYEKHNSFCLAENDKEWYKVQEGQVEEAIKKGYKIKVFYNLIDNFRIVKKLEIIEAKVQETQGTYNNQKSNSFQDDIVPFEELLNKAYPELVKIETELLHADFQNKLAYFKAIVTTKKGVFIAHGDATQENCQSSMIKPHFFRMAETRAVARALRFATNTAKVSEEEIK